VIGDRCDEDEALMMLSVTVVVGEMLILSLDGVMPGFALILGYVERIESLFSNIMKPLPRFAHQRCQ